MIPAELIEKKRDGIELSQEEIDWFIHNVMNEKIDDSQLSALLMSIYFNGMSDAETKSLVDSMVKSGKRFNFKHGFIFYTFRIICNYWRIERCKFD